MGSQTLPKKDVQTGLKFLITTWIASRATRRDQTRLDPIGCTLLSVSGVMPSGRDDNVVKGIWGVPR